MTYNPTINTQDETYNWAEPLKDIVNNLINNDDYEVKKLRRDLEQVNKNVEAYKDNAVNNFKEILKMSDSYTFEDGTKFVRSSEGDK